MPKNEINTVGTVAVIQDTEGNIPGPWKPAGPVIPGDFFFTIHYPHQTLHCRGILLHDSLRDWVRYPEPVSLECTQGNYPGWHPMGGTCRLIRTRLAKFNEKEP
jgi:hypothetical protein